MPDMLEDNRGQSPQEALTGDIQTLIEKGIQTPVPSYKVPKDFSLTPAMAGTDIDKAYTDEAYKAKLRQLDYNEHGEKEGRASLGTVVSSPKGLIDMIGVRESNANYTPEANPWGYIGKYQFGGEVFQDLGYKDKNFNWTGKNGINSSEDWLKPENNHLQESEMVRITELKRKRLIKKGIGEYLGKTINGVYISMEGAQASAHLLGAGGTMKMIKGAYDAKDGFGTSGFEYIKLANSTFGLGEGKETIESTTVPKGFGLNLHAQQQEANWLTHVQRAQLEEAQNNVPLGEQFRAVMDNRWLANSAGRWLAKNNRDVPPDPEWTFSPEDEKALAYQYSPKELKHISQAVSAQDQRYRMFDVSEDRRRLKREQTAGLAVSLVSEVLDPAGILLSFATAGLYKVNQATRLGNAMKTASLVSLEEMALETFKVSEDTSKNWEEVILAGVGAYAIALPIGALRKGSLKIEQERVLLSSQRERLAKVVRDKAQLQMYQQQKASLLARQHELGSYKTVVDDTDIKVLDANARADFNLMPDEHLADLQLTLAEDITKLDVAIAKRQDDIADVARWFDGDESDILHKNQKKYNKEKAKMLSDETTRIEREKIIFEREFHAKTGARVGKNPNLEAVEADQLQRAMDKFDKELAEKYTEVASLERTLVKDKNARKVKKLRKSGSKEAENYSSSVLRDEMMAKHDYTVSSLQNQVATKQDLVDTQMGLAKSKKEADSVNNMTKEQQVAHFGNSKSAEIVAEAKRIEADIAEINLQVKKLEDEMIETYSIKGEERLASKSNKVDSDGNPDGDSVGAMRTRRQASADELFPDASDDIASLDNAVLESAMARYVAYEQANGKNWTKFIPDFLLSDYTRINQSNDQGILALSHLLLDNPQLGDAHTVSTLVTLNDNTIRMAGQDSLDRGFLLHLTENNNNHLTGQLFFNAREKFNTQVSLAIKGLIADADLTESVKLARDGQRNLFKVAGELRKRQREIGFENLTSHDNYLPDIMSESSILKLNDDGWGKVDIVNLIARGYESGGSQMTARQAKAIAYIKYDSISSKFLSGDDIHHVLRADRVSDAKRLMESANVPQDIIDDFFTDVFTKEDWKTVSKRARKSLFIDWKAEYTHPRTGKTVKISDVMETNVAKLSEAYTIESAFGSALAEKGIKSEAQLYRMIDAVEKNAINSGSDKAKIRKHMSILKKTIPQLKGRPVVDYSNSLNKVGRVVLDSTAMLRLQQVGFASIPEFARIASELGVIETVKALRGAGMFRAPNFTSKSLSRNAQNKLKADYQLEMQNIEEMIGYVGEADFNRTWNIRSDDLGSEMTSGFAKGLDTALEGGRRIGSWLSLHQTIQGGLAKVSSLGTSRRLLKALNGSQELSSSLKNQVRMAGISDAKFEELSAFIKANGKTESFQGRQIPVWNKKAFDDADAMAYAKRDKLLLDIEDLKLQKKDAEKQMKATESTDTAMQQVDKYTDIEKLDTQIEEMTVKANEPIQSMQRDIQVLLQRLLNRSVLKGQVGEMNTNWLGGFGRYLTQFKTFSLNSLEKQLIADMRGDVASLPAKFLYGTGMAYMAYSAQVQLRALGMEDNEAEKYRREMLEDPKKLAWGVFNKHSQLAIGGIVADGMVFTGVMPEGVYDGSRYGYMNSNVDAFVPALGTAKDVLETVSAGTSVIGSMTGVSDKSLSETTEKFKKESLQIIPYTNLITLGEYIKQ